MLFKAKPILYMLVLSLMLSACQTTNLLTNWPSDIPPRQVFIDGYYDKRGITSASDKALKAHLTWIVRFYKGVPLYPQGWNKVSARYLSTLKNDELRDALEIRINKLGIEIANEWAQANNIRLINSKVMLAWGNGLRTAAQRMEHVSYISQVERDVQLLLEKKVDASEINTERYFPIDEENSDDFDDF